MVKKSKVAIAAAKIVLEFDTPVPELAEKTDNPAKTTDMYIEIIARSCPEFELLDRKLLKILNPKIQSAIIPEPTAKKTTKSR